MKLRARRRRSFAVSTLTAGSAAADALTVVDLAAAALPAACVPTPTRARTATFACHHPAAMYRFSGHRRHRRLCSIAPALVPAAAALAAAALVAPLPSPPPAFPHTIAGRAW
jgi:hypothetical protein